MQSLSDNELKEVLGEVLADELKVIHELVQDVPEIRKDVNQLKEDLSEVKADIKVIKTVVTNHDKRIRTLEAARK